MTLLPSTDTARIDPQHRLVLEVAWEALESAAVDPQRLAHTSTGVFIGISHSDHNRILYQDRSRIDGYNGPDTYYCFAANRLSYFLNLRGPSIAVDTVCSSSLTAIHLACQSLRCGDTDLALAGGVNLNLTPEEFIALSFLGVLSPDNMRRRLLQMRRIRSWRRLRHRRPQAARRRGAIARCHTGRHPRLGDQSQWTE